jgi:HEPN domain-containing protein
MSTPSPLWANFVSYGDWDLLSFAWLYEGGLHVPGYYHATQAVGKYLKALVLSVLDPDGVHETVLNNAHMWTHDLEELAEMCLGRFPFYGQPEIVARLKRFSEFDQAARGDSSLPVLRSTLRRRSGPPPHPSSHPFNPPRARVRRNHGRLRSNGFIERAQSTMPSSSRLAKTRVR